MGTSGVEAVLLLCDLVDVVLKGGQIPMSTATELQIRAFELRRSLTEDPQDGPTPKSIAERKKAIREGKNFR